MMKRIRNDWKDSALLIFVVVVFLLALLLPAACAMADDLSEEERQLLTAYESGEIIRIHVIANSNSTEDQQIKYAVRDALIEEFGDLLRAASADSDEAYRILNQNAARMLQTARCKASSMGFQGQVSAEVGLLTLPEKTYGTVILPAGCYRALRITLGSGEGENWWCVLYPQLCLALAGDNEPNQQVKWNSTRIFANWLSCEM